MAKFEFRGTGGELFKNLIVGALLTSITFGIYFPWYLVSLTKLVLKRTKLHTNGNILSLEFQGTGGELFKRVFIGYLLTSMTLGIYFPWFLVKMIDFHQNHTAAVAADGTRYSLRSNLTGGELFKTLILGGLLCSITFGIYTPWFLCDLQRLLAEKTEAHQNDRSIGTIAFRGTGGSLLKTFLLGCLLTSITMGIYFFWFQVKVLKFMLSGLEITVKDQVYRGDFTGLGPENFKVNFVGYLLTLFTFGIYSFWYMANVLRFQLGHTHFGEADETCEVEDKRAVVETKKQARARLDGRAPWAQAFLPSNEAQESPTAEVQDTKPIQEEYDPIEVIEVVEAEAVAADKTFEEPKPQEPIEPQPVFHIPRSTSAGAKPEAPAEEPREGWPTILDKGAGDPDKPISTALEGGSAAQPAKADPHTASEEIWYTIEETAIPPDLWDTAATETVTAAPPRSNSSV